MKAKRSTSLPQQMTKFLKQMSYLKKVEENLTGAINNPITAEDNNKPATHTLLKTVQKALTLKMIALHYSHHPLDQNIFNIICPSYPKSFVDRYEIKFAGEDAIVLMRVVFQGNFIQVGRVLRSFLKFSQCCSFHCQKQLRCLEVFYKKGFHNSCCVSMFCCMSYFVLIFMSKLSR